jgi:hypothetical protein
VIDLMQLPSTIFYHQIEKKQNKKQKQNDLTSLPHGSALLRVSRDDHGPKSNPTAPVS